MMTDPWRSGPIPPGLPRSSKCVLGRERKTMTSRYVASPAALHRDSASHRDPPRIAALVASRTTSTQGTLRCVATRRDSCLASRHFLSALIASSCATHRGVASLRARGNEGPQPNGSSGLGLLCLTDSEFCWRGPQVHKARATRTTYHTRPTGAEASPVERYLPTCSAVRPTHAGYPRSSNSLLDSGPPLRSQRVKWVRRIHSESNPTGFFEPGTLHDQVLHRRMYVAVTTL